jgi:hypothetical protein
MVVLDIGKSIIETVERNPPAFQAIFGLSKLMWNSGGGSGPQR